MCFYAGFDVVFRLNEEAGGVAGGVVDFHAGLGLENAGDDGAGLGRDVELRNAPALILRADGPALWALAVVCMRGGKACGSP